MKNESFEQMIDRHSKEREELRLHCQRDRENLALIHYAENQDRVSDEGLRVNSAILFIKHSREILSTCIDYNNKWLDMENRQKAELMNR